MTLDRLESGRPARVLAVDWRQLVPDEAKRLRAMGVDQGADIEVTHRGILGASDPLAVRIGRMKIALRRSHALAIEVETL